jgi:hypothetical protein
MKDKGTLKNLPIAGALYSEHSSIALVCSSKAESSVKPRWTKLILYGIDRDTGSRPWEIKANKQKITFPVLILIYEETV